MAGNVKTGHCGDPPRRPPPCLSGPEGVAGGGMEMREALRSYFGYEAFRPHQEEVVRAVLAGRDSFTVMPTGGGKSLCYQLPAVLLPGVCVVVSPLISLMKDQVDAAQAAGIRAAAFNSASSAAEKRSVWEGLRGQNLDLLYVSPERLRVPGFADFLKECRIAFFAIDEAHCISAWGHDFRPDYLALSELAKAFPQTPLAAFTATATLRVERDIVERLGLRRPLLTRASFNRPNLFYQVTPKLDIERQLLEFIEERQGESGIIYRTTRKDVEATAAFLKKRGIAAVAYHAGLPDAERTAAQESFRRDECAVIAATIAFGMGIDKPNVRFVIHGDLPKNLESYYQETGRAGRDGEPARCALFYGRADIAQLMRFAEGMEDPDARETAREQVFRMLDFTQKEGCRRKALLAYFNEDLPGDNCGGCDICAGETEREDATVPAQKLLSAVARTGGRFGARHVINVVMGKETRRIRDFFHHELPTFGVGNDREEPYWRRVMDTLLAQGMVTVSNPLMPTPALTDKGWEVLRGQRSCSIVRLPEAARTTRRRRESEDSPLFLLLKEERMRLAKQADMPAYVIFSDRSLREMVERLPLTQEELLSVSGVGRHKMDAYGGPMLDLIAAWLESHPEDRARREENSANNSLLAEGRQRRSRRAPSDDGENGSSPQTKRSGQTKGDSARETARLLDQGLSLEEVAKARGLVSGTILYHLEQLAACGKTYPPERFMTPARLDWFRALFTSCGGWQLGPVVEKANSGQEIPPPEGPLQAVRFEEARLARLLLQNGDSAADGRGMEETF